MGNRQSIASIPTRLSSSLAERIRADYARRIREGAIAAGERLPQIRAVATEYGVGLRTAARAYEMLQADGLVVSRKAVGTFAQAPADAVRAPASIFLCMAAGDRKDRPSLVMTRLQGMMRAAERRGATLTVVDCPSQFLPLARRSNAPMAVIHYSEPYRLTRFAEVDRFVQERGLPSLVVGYAPTTPSIRTRRDIAFKMLTRHLLDLGHRWIALINTSLHFEGHLVPARRMNRTGWLRAMLAAGLRPPAAHYVEVDLKAADDDPEDARMAVDAFLAASPRPTAILCVQDLLALRVIQVLGKRGLSVPRDISVAGYNGLPEGENAQPSLTTADQGLIEQGELAVEYVLNKLEGRPCPGLTVMPRLVVRESTAPPAGRGRAAQ